MLTLLGSLLLASGVPSFLGKAGSQQPRRCATSATTEGHRGRGGAKEGPLIQLRGSKPASQSGGHSAKPGTSILPGWHSWQSRLLWTSALEGLPALEGPSSPPGTSSA